MSKTEIEKAVSRLVEQEPADIDFGTGPDPTSDETYIGNFREGNFNINDAVRSCVAGGEEPISMIEAYEDEPREWSYFWHPDLSRAEVSKLKQLVVAAVPDKDLDCDAVLAILTPHVTNPELFREDYAKWERLLLAAD